MPKIKVGDLAKELKITTKELIKLLADLGVAVKTAASAIDEESARVVKELTQPKKKEEPKKVETKEIEEKPAAVAAPPIVPKPAPPVYKAPVKSIPVIESEDISVKELADKAEIKSSDIIKELMKKGVMATINQRIGAELACEIVSALGKEIEIKMKTSVTETLSGKKDSHGKPVLRPPVVTIMGHVDHGKTKLLDAIRKTKVAEGEAGGITQHIGAYQVDVHGKKVTFLDTPGHEAFTALRARGAKITDIVVLVVAADDGVMPQTIEAVDHAKAAGVPIIVAMNKIDKPGVNPDRVKQQLSDLGLVPEEWGGKTVVVPTSAKQMTGINELLEMILLVAEIQELKADPAANGTAVVVESKLEKGRGPVATVLVKKGTLRIGDVFTIGSTYGRIRALVTETGARIDKAGPSTPVEVMGCLEIPNAGDILEVMPSEKEARLLAEKRKELQIKKTRAKALSLEDFSKEVKEGKAKELNLVVKTDVHGSIEAILKSIQSLAVENIRVNIIHTGVGSVNESDIMLAKASDTVIICFNVGTSGNAESLAAEEGIEIRSYNIIYKLIDDVKLAMEGLLEPVYEEVITGHAEVRQLFRFSKVGVIAGCFVTDGKLTRGVRIRIFRDKQKIYEGKLESLKRFKEDVKMVEQNFECGISITGYEDFKAGDIVEAYEMREKSRL
jgi:translation initiation factor IF-2